MKVLNILLFLSLNLTLALFSCSKSGGSNDPVKNFTWTYDGVTYSTAVDTALIQTPGPYVITAVIGQNFHSHTSGVFISPSSFAVGTYTLTASGSNTLRYVDEQGYDLQGVSGTLNITANSNNRLAGNFSATLTGPAGNKPISGNFTNVIIK